MKKQMVFILVLTLTLLATPGRSGSITNASFPLLSGIRSPDTTYWASPDGQAVWTSCRGDLPLNGPSACALSTANTNASAGDTVYLRGGTYSGQEIRPSNSGTFESNRIVFANYNQENVLIRDSAYGIYIYKKSYITVNGINFYSLRRFMRIYAGHHNTISYCNFDQRSPESGDWVGALIADDPYDDTSASENSTHNWVHHCSFYRWVYGAYDEHRGGLLDIGSWSAGDDSSYNLIEYNTFAYGGHHTIGVYSKYNVIRNNYIHNETNPDNWDFEGYRGAITEGPSAGFCLYEGNRFGFSKYSGMALRSPNSIFRFNTFYQNGSGAIQVVSSQAGVDHADYNHIYHNSFYHNGHQATDPGFQGGMYFANWSGVSPVGNVVKNNTFYDNKNGSISYEGQVDPQEIENNWDQNDLDPGFVDLSGSDPDDPDLPDLHLNSNSAAIDAGEFLTTITSVSGSGTQFQVKDAGYFMDGWGIIEGDLVQLEGQTQRVRTSSVDYETNTITVDTAISWTQGTGISLAYEGTAPDIGAYEFVPILQLHGSPANEAIHLNWTVNVTLPATTTWQLGYASDTGTLIFPAVEIPTSTTRAHTLTGLANYTWYTITLNGMLESTPFLTDTARVMPTDIFIYLPIVLKGS